MAEIKLKDQQNTANVIAQKRMDLGLLGKLFGNREHAPSNIAGLVVVAILIIGLLSVAKGKPLSDTWPSLGPILTAALGFLFGRNI